MRAFKFWLSMAAGGLLCGCLMPAPPVVAPPPAPPPVVVPPPPPVEPPPVVVPPPTTPPPAAAAEVLARIVVGSTLAEATAAVGSQPTVVPGSGPALASARWSVAGGVVYAVLENGRVTSKGFTAIETPPEAP